MPTKKKQTTEAAVREIRRRTRRKFAPEEKVRIVLEGLRPDFVHWQIDTGRRSIGLIGHRNLGGSPEGLTKHSYSELGPAHSPNSLSLQLYNCQLKDRAGSGGWT